LLVISIFVDNRERVVVGGLKFSFSLLYYLAFAGTALRLQVTGVSHGKAGLIYILNS